MVYADFLQSSGLCQHFGRVCTAQTKPPKLMSQHGKRWREIRHPSCKFTCRNITALKYHLSLALSLCVFLLLSVNKSTFRPRISVSHGMFHTLFLHLIFLPPFINFFLHQFFHPTSIFGTITTTTILLSLSGFAIPALIYCKSCFITKYLCLKCWMVQIILKVFLWIQFCWNRE